MRGVEGALKVLKEVENGGFASEVLRKTWESISPKERSLTATLVYSTIRRQGLWKHLLTKYCKRPVYQLHPMTYSVLMLGIAGVLELRHFAPGVLVNALIQRLKTEGQIEDVGLVNAIFHKVMRDAPSYIAGLKKSTAVRDLALVNGVPGWAAAQWVKESGTAEGKQLVRYTGMKTYLSLRVTPGNSGRDWVLEHQREGKRSWISSEHPNVIRLASNPMPVELHGYKEGVITPQTESSVMVGEVAAQYLSGKTLLDMCAGRGIKTGQLLSLKPEIEIEAWDLSSSRIDVAKKEAERLGVSERVSFQTGDALSLVPHKVPDTVFLDAPCSGSGTWGRHPEGKWRILPESVAKASKLQTELLERAVSLVGDGGCVVYSTCSIFREENEGVVAEVLRSHPELVEIPVRFKSSLYRKGKPFGALIWPALPWVDGFYVAVLKKRIS